MKREAYLSTESGYFSISHDGTSVLQGEVREKGKAEVHVSAGDTVTIDKMFGPLIFWSIRVTPDFGSCEWVVEREFGPHGEWYEVVRIPGQLDSDFGDGSGPRRGSDDAERPVEPWLEYANALEAEVGRLRAKLELIAAPRRPDGTWNRDREACRQLAADALASAHQSETGA